MLDPRLREVDPWEGGDPETRKHLNKLTDLANALLQALIKTKENSDFSDSSSGGTVTEYKTIVNDLGQLELWECTDNGTTKVAKIDP